MTSSNKIQVINYHINKKDLYFCSRGLFTISTMNTQRIIKNFIYTVAGGILSLGTTGCSGNKAETTDSFSTLEPVFQPFIRVPYSPFYGLERKSYRN